MARKLVVRSGDDVWVIVLDEGAEEVRKLKDDIQNNNYERATMVLSLVGQEQVSTNIDNAILGDDITGAEAGTGHERYEG